VSATAPRSDSLSRPARVPVDPAILSERRARRRARVVARLLTVVERLLAEQDSYSELTVEEILASDGMARSTCYLPLIYYLLLLHPCTD
jgi:hypothetical protein